MANLAFHPEAQAEYEAALAWYGERSERAAVRFEAEVDRILKLIAASPERFARYDNEHRFAILRRYPYSIVYEHHAGEIYIVAIAHSARSPGYWQGAHRTVTDLWILGCDNDFALLLCFRRDARSD